MRPRKFFYALFLGAAFLLPSLLVFLLDTFTSYFLYDDLVHLEETILDFIETNTVDEDAIKVFQSYNIPNVFDPNVEIPLDNKVVCRLCNAIVNLMIHKRKYGYSRNTMIEISTVLCIHLKFGSERSCRGSVPYFLDVALYAIDHRNNITSDRFCGLILQANNCPVGDNYNWSVKLPPMTPQPTPSMKQTRNFKILHLTDIHYDPNYTPNGNAECEDPCCCQSDQKIPFFPKARCGYWSDYRNSDVPWHLVEETVRETKKHAFDFVYYTGDIFSHRQWDTAIVNNTEVLTRVNSYFKKNYNVSVFSIFGNHDSQPSSLWPPNRIFSKNKDFNIKWLLDLAATQWSQLIGKDVSKTVSKGGYYTVSPIPGFRIIALNNNIVLCPNNLWLIYDDVDVYNQLQWLSDTLLQAEKNNEKVHILSHIPIGLGYTLKAWDREFARIVERFANTITGQFNGHTHRDQLSVFYDSTNRTQAIGVAFNGGSVTPWIKSNPSFKYYEVDGTSFSMLDFEEYTFDLALANFNYMRPPQWYKLYSFREAYGVNSLMPSEMDKVLQKMARNHSLLDEYFRFYYTDADVSTKTGCNDNCKKLFLCQIVTTMYGDTYQCDRFVAMYNKRVSSMAIWELDRSSSTPPKKYILAKRMSLKFNYFYT